MQPELEIEQIAPELIGTGAQAVVENAKRLGLTWTIRLATISDATNGAVMAIYDGDTVAIGMTSMIGAVFTGQRVYVIQVPPSGNFIAGSTTGSIYRATQTAVATVSSIDFANIPTDLSVIEVRYTARFNAGGAVALNCRVNNVSAGTSPYRTAIIGSNLTAYMTPEVLSPAQWTVGILSGNNNANEFSGGSVSFNNWNAPHTSSGFLNMEFTAAVFVAGIFAGMRTGGGNCIVPSPYNHLSFFPELGNTFAAGTRFQLIGYY